MIIIKQKCEECTQIIDFKITDEDFREDNISCIGVVCQTCHIINSKWVNDLWEYADKYTDSC